MKKKVWAVILITTVMLLAACSQKNDAEPDQSEEGKLKLFTTIYPFQFFSERIGGDLIEVESIIPPGADAHSMEVTMKKMMEIAESDAFIYSGTGLESFADAVVDATNDEDMKVVRAAEDVSFITGYKDEHEEHNEENHDEKEEQNEMNVDPHVWLDPMRSVIIAENIRDAFIEIDPANEGEYKKNFDALQKELEQLNTEFQELVNSAETRKFVVSHSAYGYWEDAYGLEQIAISGLSPTDEPSQVELAKIIDTVRENNIKYIFFEPNLTNKIADMVKNETGTTPLELDNLEFISEENIDANEDYFAIMRKNIEALSNALTK